MQGKVTQSFDAQQTAVLNQHLYRIDFLLYFHIKIICFSQV